MRPGKVLQHGAYSRSQASTLLSRGPGYIHGSTRLQSFDLYVDLCILQCNIIMFNAEWHCSVFCLEMMIFNYERHRYCTLFTEAGDHKQDDAGVTDQAVLASAP